MRRNTSFPFTVRRFISVTGLFAQDTSHMDLPLLVRVTTFYKMYK